MQWGMGQGNLKKAGGHSAKVSSCRPAFLKACDTTVNLGSGKSSSMLDSGNSDLYKPGMKLGASNALPFLYSLGTLLHRCCFHFFQSSSCRCPHPYWHLAVAQFGFEEFYDPELYDLPCTCSMVGNMIWGTQHKIPESYHATPLTSASSLKKGSSNEVLVLLWVDVPFLEQGK